MSNKFTVEFSQHIDFQYTSFDRIILRGYILSLFFEGNVIKLLRNLGFKDHSNGVLKILTDQFNAHIKKISDKKEVKIHWWGAEEKQKYHSKLDFVKEQYQQILDNKHTESKIVCIIKASENVKTFANKEVTTKTGGKLTLMYSCNKIVSQYYIYIQDVTLGLCYLKISSFLPFTCEFYMNGHNYLRQLLIYRIKPIP